MSDIYQQLPPGVTPARFDAYVDRLQDQATRSSRRHLRLARRFGIRARPDLSPETVATTRRSLEQVALTDITVGGVRI